jgi:serine phosphatase RsbU (regulator of sigma subunit)
VSGPGLGHLVDQTALTRLVASATALAPDLVVTVTDLDGKVLAGPSGAPDAGRSAGAARASVVVDGAAIGEVVVTGPVLTPVSAGFSERAQIAPSLGAAAARLLADAIALAAAEAKARRSVAAAAIDDLRELSLLSRLVETIGSSLDPTQIAGCVLDTIRQPLAADVAAVLAPDPASPLLARHGPGEDVAELVREAAPVVARLRAEDPSQGACADLLGAVDGETFGSGLVAVVRTARGPHGSILLGRRRDRPAFDDADRRLLAAVASQTAIALERGALQQEIIRSRSVDDELAVGRRIQRSLMPRRFPDLPGWEIAAAYDAAREVGGDLYDAFLIRNRQDQLGFVVADVTGKGIAAAILMADARALIHAAADHASDPAETLDRVNRILVSERASGLFLTAAHGRIDTVAGRLRLASAGHEPVFLVAPDGRVTSLAPPGRLLGMVASLDATPVELPIDHGTAIVAYTDGVTEARAPDGTFYGEERFIALLAGLGGRSAREIVDAVVSDVRAFRAGADPSDDLTILVIRRSNGAVGAVAGRSHETARE